jgi:hypothetical protein
MSRLVTSNSFTREQTRLVFRMLNALLRGQDVTFYFRSPDFGAVYNKFKAMHDKWEENERGRFDKRKVKSSSSSGPKNKKSEKPQGLDGASTCEKGRNLEGGHIQDGERLDVSYSK